MTEHTIWMSLNGGEPDGGCECGAVRPDAGFYGMSFEEIGKLLGMHLDEVLT